MVILQEKNGVEDFEMKLACNANRVFNKEICHYNQNFTGNKGTKTVLIISLKIFPKPAKVLHMSCHTMLNLS